MCVATRRLECREKDARTDTRRVLVGEGVTMEAWRSVQAWFKPGLLQMIKSGGAVSRPGYSAEKRRRRAILPSGACTSACLVAIDST